MRMILCVLVLLTGCVSPPVKLDRAVISNQTGTIIHDVSVRHEPTKKTGFINAILPGRTFDLGFSSQPLMADRAVISWRSRTGRIHTVQRSLPIADVHKQRDHVLIYTIHRNGTVTVKLEPQDEKEK